MNKNKSNILRAMVVMVSAVLMFSCSSNVVYNQSHSLPQTGWDKDSVYDFAFEITDISQPYDIDFIVRNSGNYTYQNLWLFVQYQGQMNFTRIDTVNLLLADDAGKWLGKGMGSIFSTTQPYIDSVYFESQGTYHVKVTQAMREPVLQGISEIGLKVSPRKLTKN